MSHRHAPRPTFRGAWRCTALLVLGAALHAHELFPQNAVAAAIGYRASHDDTAGFGHSAEFATFVLFLNGSVEWTRWQRSDDEVAHHPGDIRGYAGIGGGNVVQLQVALAARGVPRHKWPSGPSVSHTS
jgi:hypothetical protein